jgi:hypothetical protein
MKKLLSLVLLMVSPAAFADVCSVWENPWAWPSGILLSQTEVGSFDECHDATWTAGDAYCNGLRAGAPGPNPVYLGYVLDDDNGNWENQGFWLFGCDGVPVRDN